MTKIIDASDADFENRFRKLILASREEKSNVDGVVAAILADVKSRGDVAVIDYTKRWDSLTLTPAI